MLKKKSNTQKSEDQTVLGEQQAKEIVGVHKKSSKLTILLLTLIPLIAAAAGVAYYIYIFLPKTPQNLLNSAMTDFLQNPQNYSVKGDFINENEKDYDYKFNVTTDQNGAQELTVITDAPLSDGTTTIRQVGGQFFVNFSGFVDKDGDEKLVDFAKRTSIINNQEIWLQVPEFVFFQPITTNSKIASDLDNISQESFILNNYSDEIDGIVEYSLNVESNDIYRFAKHMDGDKRGMVTEALLLYEQNNRDFPDAITLTVVVNTKTRTIENILFASSAFDAASLNVEVTKNDLVEDIIDPKAKSIESVLGYDFVDSVFFNEVFQIGANQADRQKVADMKAVALSLQVHKNNVGFYPDREEVAVGGLDFIEKTFNEVDRVFFVDPNGKPLGKNGSLYAYVPEKTDDELTCAQGQECQFERTACGQFDKIRCHQFWVATTLSDGSEFKIVAN